MESGNQRYLATINVVEQIYDFLNERFFESALSKPIITIQPDEKCHALGWFVPHHIWKDGNGYSECEINLSANFLDRNKEEISSTLLHEMCHQFAYMNDIRDCCRNGYYHNKEFAQIAMAHGLDVSRMGDRGFAHTQLNESAKTIIADLDVASNLVYRKVTLQDILEILAWEIRQEAKKKGEVIPENSEEFNKELNKRLAERQRELQGGKKPSSTRKYVCKSCGQSVRATREVDIICGRCHTAMVEDVKIAKEQ